jgi:hypothetical protein
MHFVVTHSAAALTALCVDYDFTRDFARSRIAGRMIQAKRTSLQAKGSVNGVEHIAQREVNSGVLRIQLK